MLPLARIDSIGQDDFKVKTINLKSDKKQKVLDRYSVSKSFWDSHTEFVKKQRRTDSKLRTLLRVTQESPNEMELSLMERSTGFKYDDYGSVLPFNSESKIRHSCKNMEVPRDPADFVERQNDWYRECRKS